ncbi:hypothetical protein, conserved [Trypanosoma brucei brucei TREU927]|uniref:Trypanosome variant surface glycoprotein B-type N-terminal domain-containing protein n=1 Tax=Trypanosoma brucei brucei (strain 927/4 GUTat10.1) TaxID=185431 RepID=Q585B2_TRYB2|nr:hypothetical protein, conserved [Trypanosoma brucei brucei TREU927]AAX80390.1 hypothetical protein, conserved [Trypanosoma brucei]AAZ11698.1 hypothetical protein, conserved [Trypanosoma brucei brucei TREU927]
MWRSFMQVVMVGVLVSQVTVGEDSWRNHGKNEKMFDILCSLFTKAAEGAKGENYIGKLKHARDSSTLKTETEKVKELESEVQSHENNARTAFRKAAYGENIEKEDADKTFGSHGGNQPCNPASEWPTIPKEIVCICSSVGEATDYCLGSGKARSYGHDQSGTAEDGLQAWYGVKSRCTKDSERVEVTIEAIRKDLENLRGLYSEDQEVDSPPPPPPPPPPSPPPPDSSPLQIPERPDPLASKPWVKRLDEAMSHMNKRDAALENLKEKVKRLKGTYGRAKNEEEVKALKESGAGAEGVQPSRTAPQTAARKDSDPQPTQTQTQKQNIASFPSLKITLLSVSLCFI